MVLNITTSPRLHKRHYLELMNGILKLTPRELDCLLLFMAFDPEVACSTEARISVSREMNFRSVAVINNYVKSLKDKGVIILGDDGLYRYNSIINAPPIVDDIIFRFVI
jgi:hypothetical protein